MVTVNRKARYDYALGDELTVGMNLAGPEVRAIRDHHVQLKGSFVTIRNSELWLNNLTLGAETARNIGKEWRFEENWSRNCDGMPAGTEGQRGLRLSRRYDS